MPLRWHTVVIDCVAVRAQALWWARALEWQFVQDTEDVCVIIPSWVDESVLRERPRDQIGPGMVFVRQSERKSGKNRLHIDLAPQPGQDREAEIVRLERLGATRVDVGQPPDVSWTVLADPEGNEFCVLSDQTP